MSDGNSNTEKTPTHTFTYHTRAARGRQAQILTLNAPRGFFSMSPTVREFMTVKLVQAMRDKGVEPSTNVNWDKLLEPKRIAANVTLSPEDAEALAKAVERFYRGSTDVSAAVTKKIGKVLRDRVTNAAIARHLGACNTDIIQRLRVRLERFFANAEIADPRWPEYVRGRLTKAEREAVKREQIIKDL